MSDSKKLAAPAIPRENFVPIKRAKNLEELFLSSEFRERIVASVPRHVTADRMLSVCLRAHSKDPLLLKATPVSFAGACLTATNIGLEPNSALQEAHLIPFRRTIRGRGGLPDQEVIEIQVIFGYQGLLKLVDNTGRVLTHSANVVYSGSDVFDWMEGTETYLKFKRGGRRERRPDDQPEYGYFHAALVGGGQSIEVWPYGQVLKIRNMSQAYRRALRAYEESKSQGRRPPLTWTAAPWVAHEEAMARKTMIRAGTKYLPKSAELASAVRLDEVQERRDIDYSRVIDVAGNEENPDYTAAAAMLGEQAQDDQAEYIPGGTGTDQGTEVSDPELFEQFKHWLGLTAAQRARQQTTKPAGNGGPLGSGHVTDTPPREEPKTDPSFEAYLIDEAGDYDEPPFTDPVMWAKGFIELHSRTRDMATFMENNEQALEEARTFPIADQLLAVLDEKRDLPEAQPILLKAGRGGKIDWRSYHSEFRSVLFGWRGDLAQWLEMQRPNMQEAPLPTRLMLIRAIKERCEQLKAQMPDWVISLVEQKPAPTDSTPTRGGLHIAAVSEDTDEKWVDAVLRDLSRMTTKEEITEFSKADVVQQGMRRMRTFNPNQFARADNAFAAKLAEFTSPEDDEPEPPEAA